MQREFINIFCCISVIATQCLPAYASVGDNGFSTEINEPEPMFNLILNENGQPKCIDIHSTEVQSDLPMCEGDDLVVSQQFLEVKSHDIASMAVAMGISCAAGAGAAWVSEVYGGSVVANVTTLLGTAAVAIVPSALAAGQAVGYSGLFSVGLVFVGAPLAISFAGCNLGARTIIGITR